MRATDQQLAALRACLVGNTDAWERRSSRRIQSGNIDGLGELVYAALVAAVRRRFSPVWTRSQVIRFVASLRAMLSERPEIMDALIAENMILRALGDQMIYVADPETKAQTQIALLTALEEEAGLDDAWSRRPPFRGPYVHGSLAIMMATRRTDIHHRAPDCAGGGAVQFRSLAASARMMRSR